MAAGMTYTPIATTTLGSNTSTVTFNSFSGYTDLFLVMSIKNSASADNQIRVSVNGDSGSNYSSKVLRNNSGLNYSNSTFIIAGWSRNTKFSVNRLDFLDYSNSTTYKTIMTRFDNVNDYVGMGASNWRNTAAITSISINLESGNMVTGSTFTLYGIAAA